MKTYYIIITALVFSLIACERDANVPLPVHNSKLVVYSLLGEGQPIEVFVGRSLDLKTKLTAENILVKDAKVELYEDGQLAASLAYEEFSVKDTAFWGEVRDYTKGVYHAQDLKAVGGKTYTIKVSHNEYDNIEEQIRVTPRPSLENVRIEHNVATTLDEYGDIISQSLIHMDIVQPAGSGNYYQAGIEYTFSFSDPDFGEEEYTETFMSEGIAIKEGSAYKATDKWLQGQENAGQTLSVSFLINTYGDVSQEFDEGELILFSTNEAGKKFVDTFKRQLDADELSYIPIFPQESVVVFSNVKNGYGIIGELSSFKKKL